MSKKTESKGKHGQEKEEITKKVVGTRGRIFKGTVSKKFPNRIVIEFERTVFIPKYSRYYKKKTRLHARLPQSLNVELGDLVKIQECRPLSKIIHFIVIEKIKSKEKEK